MTNTYQVWLTANDYLEIEADRYEGGAEGALLSFYKGDDVVAKFKNWIGVVKDNG
jgi:hypothetical protein